MKRLTKTRLKLLRLFFANPHQSFYLQEIGRIMGKRPGYFQRTINNLQNEGILTSKYLANARFFRVNQHYPLYDELKRTVRNSSASKTALPQQSAVLT